MNKTLLVLLVIGASAAANKVQAQGTVFLNNYDSAMGIYLSPGVAALPGTSVEVLAGPSASTLFPVMTTSGAGPVFSLRAAEVNALGPGSGTFFDEGAGILFDVPDYGTAFFQILAWYGGPTYYQSLYQAKSALWSQAVGKGPGVIVGGDGTILPTPPLPVVLQIPESIGFIPEPTIAALVALGLAIVGFRRWHKRSRNTAFQMNKTLLLLLVIGASAAANKLQAQGTVFLNNYDAHAGIYDGIPLPAPADSFVEIFGGPLLGSWVPLVNSAGQGPIFQIQASGVQALGPCSGSYFDAGKASVPGLAPGEMGWFLVRAWCYASSYDAAPDRNSALWHQTVGSPANPAALIMPTLDLFTPEPSPAALAGLALEYSASGVGTGGRGDPLTVLLI